MKQKVIDIMLGWASSNEPIETTADKIISLFSVQNTTECYACGGYGFIDEHADHPHPQGDCCGQCPIQIECYACLNVGRISNIKANKNEEFNEDDLPF